MNNTAKKHLETACDHVMNCFDILHRAARKDNDKEVTEDVIATLKLLRSTVDILADCISDVAQRNSIKIQWPEETDV